MGFRVLVCRLRVIAPKFPELGGPVLGILFPTDSSNLEGQCKEDSSGRSITTPTHSLSHALGISPPSGGCKTT